MKQIQFNEKLLLTDIPRNKIICENIKDWTEVTCISLKIQITVILELKSKVSK